MKRTFLLFLLHFLVFNAFAQTPGVVSTKNIRNSNGAEEVIYDSKTGINGGYVVVGADTGFSFNKAQALTKSFPGRPWIAKLDNSGNRTWNNKLEKNGLFSHFSGFTSVCKSLNGLYVAAGYAQSPSNVIVAAYDASGLLVWDTAYGGSGIDRANCIQPTSDGGFILAGYTTSNNGAVSGNHSPGVADIWLVKMDANRVIQWQKCYGGSGADTAYTVLPTPDNGFVVAGVSASANGDLTGNNGLSDGWVFKINSTGNFVWQKNIGSGGHEAFRSIVINSDSSYTLTGYTTSPSVLSNGLKGRSDIWTIKIAGNNGSVIWSKGYGGSLDEQGFSIQRTPGNGYLVAGYTDSPDGDVTNKSGASDAWLLNLDSEGSLLWQKTAGGNRSDVATTAFYSSENEYVATGFTGPLTATGDSTDGYFVRLGNTGHLKGSLIAPRLMNSGVIKAIKTGREYSTIPVNGTFSMDIDTGSYTVSYDPQNQYYTSSAPVVINLVAYFDTATANFNITALPAKRDLSISAMAVSAARPGFNVSYRLFYKNSGTDTVANGQIIFKKDSRLNFISASPGIGSVNGDSLKWNFSNLKPFDSASITINLQVQAPPAVNINDTLTSLGFIIAGIDDLTPADDTVILAQRVQGSFDPNDKTENLAGKISVQQISAVSYINYLVRFQNTGTDTAFNISIRDTLDQKLDWSSFQMISSSHAYKLTITSQNQLKWNFNDIKLVDSSRNQTASHGFIAYRIKPKNNLLIGDIIKNNASIYFDYNLPVKTNTQETKVVNNNIIIVQPMISSFNPSSAASGATVTITGTNLTGATAVSFGGSAATSFIVNSSTSITATVGTGASGNVSVTTPGGTATLGGFTFIPAPNITSFAPGSAANGTLVTITGTNLTGATAVSFGGTAATSFTVNSSTSITATVGTGASGNVSVTTPGGIASLAGFTFIPPPTITSFNPTTGAEGASITITGTNFTGASAVSFGGVAPSLFTVNSSTGITAVVGTGASGDVSVTTPGGTAILAGFTFIPAPTITSFTPTSGGAGASITITGTGLTDATAVSFGGVAANSFVINSATSITVVVGTGASGDVSVTTPGGTVTLPGFTFTVVTAIDPIPANALGIRFYPNPTTGSFVIDTLKLSDNWETLEILDGDGRLKLAKLSIKNKARVNVSINYFSNGMYVAILRRQGGQPAIIKFLKL